jgi:hypothetical protein
MLRSPWGAAERFGVEDLIDPSKTRRALSDWANLAYRALGNVQLGPKAKTGVRP